VLERTGVDINPIDPTSEPDRERLLSYVWPDQLERLERTEAALDLAAGAPWQVERGAAAVAVAARFGSALPLDRVSMLVHTIVWQYLPQADRDAITQIMSDAAHRATDRSPVAWFSMEADDIRDGAGLYLGVWPGAERKLVGRADFHGRWVRWL
jgi:hypothetical protein